MKIKNILIISSCIIFSSTAFAAEFQTGVANDFSAGGPFSNRANKHPSNKLEEQTVYFSVKFPGESKSSGNGFALMSSKHDRNAPRWIDVNAGERTPAYAVIGGIQPQPYAVLYVCRAHYEIGIHPGNLYQGQCHITWNAQEINLPHYQVLISRTPLHWAPASHGGIPLHAIQGGSLHDVTFYICQAEVNGGTHIGKLVGENCSVGWDGKEVLVPEYGVLVK